MSFYGLDVSLRSFWEQERDDEAQAAKAPISAIQWRMSLTVTQGSLSSASSSRNALPR